MTSLELNGTPTESPRRRKQDCDEEPLVRVRWSVVLQVVGYAVALFVVYNALTNRVTAIETRVDSLRGDVSEMKADIKTLLRKQP